MHCILGAYSKLNGQYTIFSCSQSRPVYMQAMWLENTDSFHPLSVFLVLFHPLSSVGRQSLESLSVTSQLLRFLASLSFLVSSLSDPRFLRFNTSPSHMSVLNTFYSRLTGTSYTGKRTVTL